MFPIGFALPAVVVLLVALFVAVRELLGAADARARAGNGPLLAAAGETLLIVGALTVFLQGWVAGLVLAPMAAFVVFLGGTTLTFFGMGMESVRAQRR
jgi:CDP-diglyceride synthetase